MTAGLVEIISAYSRSTTEQFPTARDAVRATTSN